MSSSHFPAQERLNICQQTVEELAHILSIIPSGLLSLIMETNPTSGIKVVKGLKASYARWSVSWIVREILMGRDWETISRQVRVQGACDECWALVTAELISAVRFLKQRDVVYTQYSVQDLLDHADRSRVGTNKKEGHFCYLLSIRRALNYVLRDGIQREADCPYVGCRHVSKIPKRTLEGLGRIDRVDKLSLSEALLRLEHQPIGASLFVFMPDYLVTKGGVYRGPMRSHSAFEAMHGVTVLAVIEENGEKLFKVRLNHGELAGHGGLLKVSMEVMLVQVPTEGEDSDGKFQKPKMLLTDFMCPTIFDAMQ